MLSRLAGLSLVVALAGSTLYSEPVPQAPQAASIPEIPYTKFVLKNGLTLIVHEDHKAPIAAVNVWYHVGSKNEKPGRTGFAHLFEHLMFNGSEHYNNDYFKAVEPVGATDLNGTTNEDRTNYFQNVPISALDRILWLESDRMGHLVGVIDKARLDEQRGVVQNEKRQGENGPYGKSFITVAENTYPKGHPYSWSVIGSMDDLNAASLDDVKDWFAEYYGAANATLVVAGDVNPQDIKQRVEKYFGDIPSGPPLIKPKAWVAKRTGVQRQTMQDRVPQTRIIKVWNVAQFGTADSTYLGLVVDLLAGGGVVSSVQATRLQRPHRHERRRLPGRSRDQRTGVVLGGRAARRRREGGGTRARRRDQRRSSRRARRRKKWNARARRRARDTFAASSASAASAASPICSRAARCCWEIPRRT